MSIKQIRQLAKECIHNYSRFDRFIGRNYIEVSDIPETVQNELSALIMSIDEEIAQEATSADNSYYFSHMLPALNKFLLDSTNKDKEIEFVSLWNDGIRKYNAYFIQKILDEECYHYNDSLGFCAA